MGPGVCRRTRLYFCFDTNRELGTCSTGLVPQRGARAGAAGTPRGHLSHPRTGLKPGFLDTDFCTEHPDTVGPCLHELIEKRFYNCFVVSSLFLAAFWPRIEKKMLSLSFSGPSWLCLISLYFTAFFPREPTQSHGNYVYPG